VLTSLSSRTVRVRALVQSPQSALPLVHQGRLAFSTTTQLVALAPFQSSLLEYGFYWPAPGLFRHYPLQIYGASGRLVGCARAGRALGELSAPVAPEQALAAAWPPSLAAPAPASAGSSPASVPTSSLDATDPALEWQRIKVLASDAEVLAFLRQMRLARARAGAPSRRTGSVWPAWPPTCCGTAVADARATDF
jgi:hypothetical protein